MTLYKVRMFHVERRKATHKEVFRESHVEVYVDNLEAAKADYEEQVRNIRHHYSYTTRGVYKSGGVELYIPHIHDNGLVAYWPDGEKYIEQVKFEA